MSSSMTNSSTYSDEGEPKLKYLFMRHDSALDSTVSSRESFSSISSIGSRTYSGNSGSRTYSGNSGSRTYSGNSSRDSWRRRRRQTVGLECESSDNDPENAADDEVFLENKNNNSVSVSKKQRERTASQEKDRDPNSCLFCNTLVKEKQYYLWESRFTRSAFCSRCVKDGSGKRYISYWGTPAYEHGSWRKRYRNGKSTNIDLTPLIDVLQKIDNMDTSMGKPRRPYMDKPILDKYEDTNNNNTDTDNLEVDQNDRTSEDNKNANRVRTQEKENVNKTKSQHIHEEVAQVSNEISEQIENYSNENIVCKKASFTRIASRRTQSPKENRTRRIINDVDYPNSNNAAETQSPESAHGNTKAIYTPEHHQNKPRNTSRNHNTKNKSDVEKDQYLRSDSDSEFDDVVVKAAEFIENEFINHVDSDVKIKTEIDRTYRRKHPETATSSRRESECRQSDDDLDVIEDDQNYKAFEDGLHKSNNEGRARIQRRKIRTENQSIAQKMNDISNNEKADIDFIDNSDVGASQASFIHSRRPSMQRRKGSLLYTEIREEESCELINLSNETTNTTLCNAEDSTGHSEDNKTYMQFYDSLQQANNQENASRQRRRSRDKCNSIDEGASHISNDEESGYINKLTNVEESIRMSRRPSMQRRKGSLLDTEIVEETSNELINKSNDPLSNTQNGTGDNKEQDYASENESGSSNESARLYNSDRRRLSRAEADLMLSLNNAESTEDEDASFMKIRNKIANLSNLSKRIGRGNDLNDRQNYKATGYLLDKYLRRARRASLKARRKSSLAEIPKDLAHIQNIRNDENNQSPQRHDTDTCSVKSDFDLNERGRKTSNMDINSKKDVNGTNSMEHRSDRNKDNEILTKCSQERRKSLKERKNSISDSNTSRKYRHEKNKNHYDHNANCTEVTNNHSPLLQEKEIDSATKERNYQVSKRKPDYQRDKADDFHTDKSRIRKQQSDGNDANTNVPNTTITEKHLLKAKSDLQSRLSRCHSERPKKTSLQETKIADNDKYTKILALDSDDSDEQELSWRSRGYSNDFYLTRKSIIGTEIIRSFNKAVSRRTKHDNQSSDANNRRKPASAPASRKSSRASLAMQSSRENNSSVEDIQISGTTKRKISSSAPVSRTSSNVSLVEQFSRGNNAATDSDEIASADRLTSRESRESKDSDYRSAESSDSEPLEDPIGLNRKRSVDDSSDSDQPEDPTGLNRKRSVVDSSDSDQPEESTGLTRKRSVADLRAAFEKAAAQTTRTYGRFRKPVNVAMSEIQGVMKSVNGDSFPVTGCDDDVLLPTSLIADVQKKMSDILNLPYQDGDLLLCSYPKSGTHWVFHLIAKLVRGRSIEDEPPALTGLLEIASVDGIDRNNVTNPDSKIVLRPSCLCPSASSTKMVQVSFIGRELLLTGKITSLSRKMKLLRK